MILTIIKKIVRRIFLLTFKFAFVKVDKPKFENIREINLYVHIPFCRHLCPYCPYNKIEYDRDLILPYFSALKNEADLVFNEIGSDIKVNSIYIGGGSPAIVIEELSDYLNYLKSKINLSGEVCIELNPLDCSKEKCIKLKEAGITQVSLGVQSFNKKYLDFIGRKYNNEIIDDAIKNLKDENFKSVNIDMMFALGSQTVEELKEDLEKTLYYEVDQVTNYPLFTFPYSSVGKYLKIKKVRMPSLRMRKKQYGFVYDFFTSNDFHQVSVWSFVKGIKPKYSSVTRDNYIGLGAGAGTHLDNGFYLNTFDVKSYVDRCDKNKNPTALCLKFSEKANNFFWLYWRFYEGILDLTEIKKRFKKSIRVRFLIKVILFLNLGHIEDDLLIMNKRGFFWIHLAQNYYSLSYINKIWTKAMKESFPNKISF